MGFVMNEIFKLLRSDGSIVVNKNLAKNIGLCEAILYSELISRYSYFEERDSLDSDSCFYNTVEDLEEGTTLSDYQQRKAIKTLVNLKLLSVKLKGLPAKRYFKMNFDTELILKYLKSSSKKTKGLRIKKTKELDMNKLDINNTNEIILNNNTKIIKDCEPPKTGDSLIEKSEIEEIEMNDKQEDLFGEQVKPKAPDCSENVKNIHDYFLLMMSGYNAGYMPQYPKERRQIKDLLKSLSWKDGDDIPFIVKCKIDNYFDTPNLDRFGYSLGFFILNFNTWTEENARRQKQQQQRTGNNGNPTKPKGNSAGVYVDSSAGRFGWDEEDYRNLEAKVISGDDD